MNHSITINSSTATLVVVSCVCLYLMFHILREEEMHKTFMSLQMTMLAFACRKKTWWILDFLFLFSILKTFSLVNSTIIKIINIFLSTCFDYHNLKAKRISFWAENARFSPDIVFAPYSMLLPRILESMTTLAPNILEDVPPAVERVNIETI